MSSNTISLKGKVALITGGSRGLGRAMAQAFAEAGADLAIVSRKLPACEETAAELAKLGVKTYADRCHVANWDEIEPMVNRVYDKFGKIDVLVNNAGMSPLYPSLEEVTEDNFDKVIGVNFKGPFRLSALVGARMHRGNGGSIINISSIASLEASPYALPYAGAKAALNTITDGFAAAYSPNVRVNTICVGPFATDVAEHWADPPNHDNPGWTKNGLRVGLPQEMTGAALWLASDQSMFTNAALIRIDGGPVRAKLSDAKSDRIVGSRP
jgi:NAD(P)-dependent dehydrogenase (short-subunit alcohol dehydrogenase family)